MAKEPDLKSGEGESCLGSSPSPSAIDMRGIRVYRFDRLFFYLKTKCCHFVAILLFQEIFPAFSQLCSHS